MHVEISIHFKRGRQEILMCLAAHSQYFLPVVIFACGFTIYILCPLSSPVEIVDSISQPNEVDIIRPLSYICLLIHNFLCPLSSSVEIIDSISQPTEVNNSTIELYLPVDSQLSSLIELTCGDR